MRSLAWITPDWPYQAGIHALTSCRHGGLSGDRWSGLNLATHVGDNPEAVRINRQRLQNEARLPGEPIWLNQVHGNKVLTANQSGASASSAHPCKADACFTDQSDHVCAVLTADCLPILVCSADGKQLAAIHAGWRGLEQGVIQRTLKLFSKSNRSPAAWIGPAISSRNYRVDERLKERFLSLDPSYQCCFKAAAPTQGKPQWQMDLAAVATFQLSASGVEKIYSSGICNYADNRFYSHRRDGPTGRMVTLIWRSTPNSDG